MWLVGTLAGCAEIRTNTQLRIWASAAIFLFIGSSTPCQHICYVLYEPSSPTYFLGPCPYVLYGIKIYMSCIVSNTKCTFYVATMHMFTHDLWCVENKNNKKPSRQVQEKNSKLIFRVWWRGKHNDNDIKPGISLFDSGHRSTDNQII